MSSNTQEYTERLQHWAIISLSPQSKGYQEVRIAQAMRFCLADPPLKARFHKAGPLNRKSGHRPRNFLIIFALHGPLRQGAGDVAHKVRQISPSGKVAIPCIFPICIIPDKPGIFRHLTSNIYY